MVEKGHYVTRWKGIGNGRELFEMSHGFIMTTSKLGLFYLKTQNRDYLYNTKYGCIRKIGCAGNAGSKEGKSGCSGSGSVF